MCAHLPQSIAHFETVNTPQITSKVSCLGGELLAGELYMIYTTQQECKELSQTIPMTFWHLHVAARQQSWKYFLKEMDLISISKPNSLR